MATWLDCKIKDIYDYCHKDRIADLVGVEVELEGEGITKISYRGPWRLIADGSLRGEAMEAVLAIPLSVADACLAVIDLYKAIKNDGCVIKDSMRAGVHVHINCQDLTVRQLFTFMAAYYCLEDLLTEDLGEERSGNLFCLRLSDAEEISFALLDATQRKSIQTNHFTNENLRYAAMNLVSISKFGSLEFRALRTPAKPEPIIRWIRLLDTLYNNSKKFKDPKELLDSMSANGDKEVVSQLLGGFARPILIKNDFDQKIYEAIRNIQTWVYLTDWS